MRRVLVSPVGGSDPIRNNKDGSLLHICRYYLPDVVYLYLSHEMYENHVRDNRYVYCLEELGKQTGHHFQIHLIIRNEITEVQKHEIFYEEFRNEITKIMKEMEEEDELLVNIASGTPAMKNALLVLNVLGEFRFTAVQVKSPLGKINRTDENIYSYEVEEEWRADEDNEQQCNRCEEVASENLETLLNVKAIKQLIEHYDYSAALLLARGMKDRLNEEALLILEQAYCRMQLNCNRVIQISKLTGYMPMPVTKAADRDLVEYLLLLQVKERRGTFDDFVRGISPAITLLFTRILEKHCQIYLSDYTTKDTRGMEQWDLHKLKGTKLEMALQKAYPRGFKEGPVYAVHLQVLISAFDEKHEAVMLCEDMRLVEERARNRAAHTVDYITQERKKAGLALKRERS